MWIRRLTPGLPDLVFGLVLASVLVGGRYRLLNDPGTLWHLRLGREILSTGTVPRVDSLTFTHAGEPWVDQSWLFDVGLALVVGHAGWSAAALICALGIASVYSSLARGLLADGRSALVVLVVSVLAAGVGAIHFLVRPHLLTLGFVGLTLQVCQQYHERKSRRIFLLPLLTVIWANVHGGFLAGPMIVFTAAIGHAISGAWDSDRRRGVKTLLCVGVLCLLAATINPYGLGLYRHVGRLLVSSGVTELIEEYQPVPFGKPDARAFEWVLLGLVVLPAFSVTRMSRYELAHAVVWLHLSLASVRHAPLFALAVAPGLARLLDGLPLSKSESDGFELGRRSAWPILAGVVLSVAVIFGAGLSRLDPDHWPLAALPVLKGIPADAHLFHEQDWGGLIEAECRPTRKAFLDDRFELYGKASILRYLNAIEGGPDWDQLSRRDAISLVWVRPGRGLARRLSRNPDWAVRHSDDVSILFEKVTAAETGRSVARTERRATKP